MTTNWKISWTCAWKWGHSYFQPCLSRPASLRCFRLAAGGSSIHQPPAHLFDSKNSSKRSKRDISLLPPVLFALTKIPPLTYTPARPLLQNSPNLPLKQLWMNSASIKSPGSSHVEMTFSITRPWKIDELALMCCSYCVLFSLAMSLCPLYLLHLSPACCVFQVVIFASSSSSFRGDISETVAPPTAQDHTASIQHPPCFIISNLPLLCSVITPATGYFCCAACCPTATNCSDRSEHF